METWFIDKWGDSLNVSFADGEVFFTSTIDGAEHVLSFDPNTALYIAEYILRGMRKAKGNV